MVSIKPIALGILAAAMPLQAQSDQPKAEKAPDEMDLMLELMDLLATPISGASKREQRLMDSPQAIEVLTAEDIRRMGIYRIQDALKLMTSIDYLEGDMHVVGMRGVMQDGQPRTVQVLIDGVPLYNPLSGSIDLSNLPIPIHMVEKIEVVRGPSSTLYGANAVCGVVAITTQRAKEGFGSEGRLSRANHITWRGGANASFKTNHWNFIAGYSGQSMRASGWKTHFIERPNYQRHYLDAPQTSASADPYIASDAAHGFNALARAEFNYKDMSLYAQGGQSEKCFGGSSYFPFRMDQKSMALLGWRQVWSSRFTTEVRLHQTEQAYHLGPNPILAVVFGDPDFLGKYATYYDSKSQQAELQINWTLGDHTFVVAGADTRIVRAEKSIITGLPRAYEESANGGFLSVDHKPNPQWTFSAGVRAENETLGGSRLSPRATVVYNPNPKTVVRAGYYTSTRSPQITESRANYRFFRGFFFDAKSNPANPVFLDSAIDPSVAAPPNLPVYTLVVENPGIKPEKTTNFEVGLRQSLGAFSFDLTIYRMLFTELVIQATPQNLNPIEVGRINPPGTPFTYPAAYVLTNRYWNAGEATNQGLEMAITWATHKNWTSGLNATWLDYQKKQVLPDDPMQSKDFAYAVDFKSNAWVRFRQDSWSGYASLQYVGDTTAEALSADNLPYFEHRDAFFQFNANLDYAWNPHFSTGLYVRNGARNMTPQGASCMDRGSAWVGMRREYGFSVAYQF